MNAFGASPYSATAFQTTDAGANRYNPVCPWPLIKGMVQQIATYVNQMEAAQGGVTTPGSAFPGGRVPFTGMMGAVMGGPRMGGMAGMTGPYRRK